MKTSSYLELRAVRLLAIRRWLVPGIALLLSVSVAAAEKGGPRGPRKADLSNLVVVGDSLSAGFQNFSLLGTQQEHGYAAVLAKQAGSRLILPIIAAPGIPNALQLIQPGFPPVIRPASGTLPALPRVNYTQQATNLGIPAATLNDALTLRPFIPSESFAKPYVDMVLGFPACAIQQVCLTQMETALALRPTTLIVWLGNNDVLLPAMHGGTLGITDPVTFRNEYRDLMRLAATTGATLVVANIPDITQVAAITPADKFAALMGQAAQQYGLVPGSYVYLPAIQDVLADLIVNPQPLPAYAVLGPAEAAFIRDTIRQYNQAIADEALAVGATLVDIRALVDEIYEKGYEVHGQRLTCDFLNGLFSLDGVHPTNTGYAIIANEFIKTMNRNLATGIPPIAVVQVAKEDPLVPVRGK